MAKPIRSLPWVARYFVGHWCQRLLNVCLSWMLLMPVANGTELIVLAAPISSDGYYADVESDIIDFHVEYAKSVAKYDNVLVLTDESHAPLYKRALGDDQVVIMPMADI
jgi:hypothetical protein